MVLSGLGAMHAQTMQNHGTLHQLSNAACQHVCVCVTPQGESKCFSQYASRALRDVQAQMAAAVKEGSSSSSNKSSSSRIARSTYDSVAPRVLDFAQLLTQYGSYNTAQRRQLLDALQQQLLPQVSSSIRCPPLYPCDSCSNSIPAIPTSRAAS